MIQPRPRFRPSSLAIPALPLLAALLASACAPPSMTMEEACAAPANEIVAENCLEGHPATEWDINGYGDPSIQGFGTDIAINRGEAIEFKVDTDSDDYRIDIYRMGYYGGMGARRVDSFEPSATLPQIQPECLRGPIPVLAEGGGLETWPAPLVDCGNWAVSASWQAPEDATSGIYFARLVREDPDRGLGEERRVRAHAAAAHRGGLAVGGPRLPRRDAEPAARGTRQPHLLRRP